MITSVNAMIEQYVNAWNEQTLEAYQREFAKCWTADTLYSDPYSENTGVSGISRFALTSLEKVPVRKFSILEAPEYHHHYGRYSWQVDTPNGANTGYDYFEFNDEFRITKLISFFKLP